MAEFFYADANGQKQGPFNFQQLQTLAERGIITATTPLETTTGDKGLARQVSGLKFNMTAPSAPSSPAEPNPFSNASPVSVDDSNTATKAMLGKVLTSDGGLRPAEVLLWGIGILAISGFLAWLLCAYIPGKIRETKTSTTVNFRFGHPDFTPQKNPFAERNNSEAEQGATIVFFIGVVAVVAMIFISAWVHIVWGSSKITVYEKGIDGVFLNKTQLYTESIQLFYDQISSVDNDWNSIAINVSGTKYRFIVTKPAEIRSIIIEQQRKSKS